MSTQRRASRLLLWLVTSLLPKRHRIQQHEDTSKPPPPARKQEAVPPPAAKGLRKVPCRWRGERAVRKLLRPQAWGGVGGGRTRGKTPAYVRAMAPLQAQRTSLVGTRHV